MKRIINPRTGVLAGMIILAGVWRLLIATPVMTPFSNFTPVGAMALFGGYYYKSTAKAFFVPLITLWLSDLWLNYFVYYHYWKWFYDGFLWTYLAFALMAVIGMLMKKVSIKNVILAAVIATFTHWIITDFGVWFEHGLDITTGKAYTMDLAGFLKCLYLALPFEKDMLIGNLAFGGAMFGVFEWAQKKYSVLRLNLKQAVS